MASSMIIRPDLFDSVVIGYPVLDMLRFDKLYIGRAWVPEYGDPENPEHREYLAKYSPYHIIRPGSRYPPIYLSTPVLTMIEFIQPTPLSFTLGSKSMAIPAI